MAFNPMGTLHCPLSSLPLHPNALILPLLISTSECRLLMATLTGFTIPVGTVQRTALMTPAGPLHPDETTLPSPLIARRCILDNAIRLTSRNPNEIAVGVSVRVAVGVLLGVGVWVALVSNPLRSPHN